MASSNEQTAGMTSEQDATLPGQPLPNVMSQSMVFELDQEGPPPLVDLCDEEDEAPKNPPAHIKQDVDGSIPPGATQLDTSIQVDEDLRTLEQSLLEAGQMNIKKAEALLYKATKHMHAEQAEQDIEQESSDEDNAEALMFKELKEKCFLFSTAAIKGNPIGGRWARYLKANSTAYDNYRNMGRMERKKTRTEWCEGLYTTYMETKTFTKEVIVDETTEGHWMSLERMAVEEGGGEQGWRNAVNYAIRSIQEGPKFVGCLVSNIAVSHMIVFVAQLLHRSKQNN